MWCSREGQRRSFQVTLSLWCEGNLMRVDWCFGGAAQGSGHARPAGQWPSSSSRSDQDHQHGSCFVAGGGSLRKRGLGGGRKEWMLLREVFR